MDTQIMIRDGGPYGPGLSLPAAIARLCDGGLVTVTAVGPGTPDGDPHVEPRHGFDITVYPARAAYGQQQPPTVNWAGIGSRPAADASLGQATLGHAAAIGAGHGQDAARQVFDGNTPEQTYRLVLRGIEDGDPAIMDAYQAPVLSAGSGYTETDLAGDLGLAPGDEALPGAVTAYLDAAGESFWHETERIAREHL
jgi:hypothetical protein